jgi:tetratricopeptide (TPR) repeat protein
LSGQDTAIRQSELEDAISRLRTNRRLVIQKEPGSKCEGFVGCIDAELRRGGDVGLPHALYIRCAGVTGGKQLQDLIELAAGHPMTVLGDALREGGGCLLILDELDYPSAGTQQSLPTIDGTIEALHDFCPNLLIVRITSLPCPDSVAPIKIGPLQLPDTRSYLNKAPRPVKFTSMTDYARVHRATGGVLVYLDEFINALGVTNIEGAIAQVETQPVVSPESLHASVVKEIDEIHASSTDEMKRTRSLLRTLTVLEQGESLTAIKRLDSTAPIWPRNASYLQNRGCLDSITITPRLTNGRRVISPVESDKILRIPRLVRDYVLSIMTEEERREIVRTVAKLYFSEDWRLGIVRMRRRLAVGTEISTHQSGNEMTILKLLLQSPTDYFQGGAAGAFQLALSYVGQLKSKGFFGEAYEAAKDTIAIVESLSTVYAEVDVYHIRLAAASCARMVGEREACVEYLQAALPFVRESDVKARLTDALVNMAMAYKALNKKAEALETSKEILETAPKNSSDYLQAKAIQAEINMKRPDAIRYLKTLARKARNLKHFTVADNVTLEIVAETDNTEEKLKMLSDIKSRRDLRYNFVRATIRRIETLIDANRESELTDLDREDLLFSYQLAYSQRLVSIFDWCHRVYWKYLIATNNNTQLGDLYMYSSFVWRLNGDVAGELSYSLQLQQEMAKTSIKAHIVGIIGYVARRIAALTGA